MKQTDTLLVVGNNLQMNRVKPSAPLSCPTDKALGASALNSHRWFSIRCFGESETVPELKRRSAWHRDLLRHGLCWIMPQTCPERI